MSKNGKRKKAGARAPRLDVRMHDFALRGGGTASVPMASAESLGELSGEGADAVLEGIEALVAEGKLVAIETEEGALAVMAPEEAKRYASKPVPPEELLGADPEEMDPEAFQAALVAEVKEGVRSGALVLVKAGGADGTPLAIPAKDYDGEAELVPMEELDAVEVVAFAVPDLVAWGVLAVVRERDGSLGMRLPSDAMEEGLEPIPWTEKVAEELARQNGARA